jgi:hypothetical protein
MSREGRSWNVLELLDRNIVIFFQQRIASTARLTRGDLPEQFRDAEFREAGDQHYLINLHTSTEIIFVPEEGQIRIRSGQKEVSAAAEEDLLPQLARIVLQRVTTPIEAYSLNYSVQFPVLERAGRFLVERLLKIPQGYGLQLEGTTVALIHRENTQTYTLYLEPRWLDMSVHQCLSRLNIRRELHGQEALPLLNVNQLKHELDTGLQWLQDRLAILFPEVLGKE